MGLFKEGLYKALVVVLSAGLFACGGGDDDGPTAGTGNTGTDNPALKTGVLLDAPVSGMEANTPTWGGITNAGGEFHYVEGENVTFSIGGGGITFPPVPAADIVTPLDMAGTRETNNQTVINILRLLQTFDDDGDPANGINLSPDLTGLIPVWPLDFSQDDAAFESAVTPLLNLLSEGLVPPRSLTLVSRVAAQAHFESSLFQQMAGKYSGTFSGDDTGTWEITVDEAGKITGTARSNVDQITFQLLGTVLPNGTAAIGAVSSGAAFNGNLSLTGSFSGTWSNAPDTGTFSGGKVFEFNAATVPGVYNVILDRTPSGAAEVFTFGADGRVVADFTDEPGTVNSAGNWSVDAQGRLFIDWDPSDPGFVRMTLTRGAINSGRLSIEADNEEDGVYEELLTGSISAAQPPSNPGDSTPPTVTITNAPASPTNSTTASLSFASNEAGTSFSCALDGGFATPCTSPQGYNGLSEGPHTFQVIGTDSSNNASTPASHRWTVDITPPTVSAPEDFTVVAANTSSVLSSDAAVAAFLNGVTAVDNIDVGNIPATHNAPNTLRVGATTVIFSATDTAGNRGSASSLVRVVPPDPDKFLTFQTNDNEASARAYYALVDPDGFRTTLAGWKQENGFNDALPDSGADAHALYQNDADLGFVRDVYIIKNIFTGNVAAYIQNYRTLEGAIRGYTTGDKSDLIATVTMEYSDPTQSGGPRFTTFYAYAGPVIANADPTKPVGRRLLSADLDGRGEKFLPGLCASCHGGTPNPVPTGSDVLADADIGAGFLPWDLEVFKYATNPGFTRIEQEVQFKELNRAVLETNPTMAAKELIEGWYGGRTLPNAFFDPAFVPAAWNTSPSVHNLYLDVVAPSCRACHIQRANPATVEPLGQTLDFSSYAKFLSLVGSTETAVFDQGMMPFAKRTFEHFWGSRNPYQPEVLAQHLEGLGSFSHRLPGGKLLKPGRPIAKPGSYPNQPLGEPFSLDGGNSLFANTYSWEMKSRPLGSLAVLSGVTTATPSFMPDVVGAYQIGLIVNNGLVDSEEVIVTINVVGAALEVTFDSQIEALLQGHCGGCHSGAFPSAGFDVGSYTQVLAKANLQDTKGQSTLYSKPNGTHPNGHVGGAGSPAITAGGLQTLLDWINAGGCQSSPCP